MGISKSKYTLYRQCSKALWLKQNHPELAVVDPGMEARFFAGNQVGDLAMGLFGDYVEVSAYQPDGKLDLSAMIAKTNECLSNSTDVICEASFTYDGNYCAVDILKKEKDGYAIYEVKSSTDADKDVYAQDVAYQKWLLMKCGINITGTYLVCVNSDYVLDDELNIHEFFKIEDISQSVEREIVRVGNDVKVIAQLLQQQSEPTNDLDVCCHKPYDCAFWNYCSRHLPTPSVFDLYRMNFGKKVAMYHAGQMAFEDLDVCSLTDKRQMQVACTLNSEAYINKNGIKQFLDTLSYPMYFLDFETEQPVIPKYKGTRPYQQVPFQYSLHIIEHENGPLLHTEFLGDSVADPRRALAEQLCRDIPMNVCVLAYNKAFECTRLREMAEAFPELSTHLLNIKDNIKDLLNPFQHGHYYLPAMGGSFSIKVVLPALFPNDPELDYHNLDGDVHNGSEAMNIYPMIAAMSADEQERARQSLLKYCELDTYAMVKVWEKLRDVVEK